MRIRCLPVVMVLTACGGGGGGGGGGLDGTDAAPRVDGMPIPDYADAHDPLALTECVVEGRVDVLGGVDASATLAVGTVGDHWVAAWLQSGSVSKDLESHLVMRMRRDELGDIIDLGRDDVGRINPITFDMVQASGILQRYSGQPSGERTPFHLAGDFEPTDDFTTEDVDGAFAARALENGGMISFYQAPGELLVERWTAGDPWTDLDLAGTPAAAINLRVVSAIDRYSVLWQESDGDGGQNIAVAVRSFGAWLDIGRLSFPAEIAPPTRFEAAQMPDGDVVVVYVVDATLYGSTFDHVEGVFSEPQSLATDLDEPGFNMYGDREGYVTLGYRSSGDARVRRRLAGSWGPVRTLGPADSTPAVYGEEADGIAVLWYEAPDLHVAVAPWDSDELRPGVTVGIGMATEMELPRQAFVAVDAFGRPTVIAMDEVDDPEGVGISYATCH